MGTFSVHYEHYKWPVLLDMKIYQDRYRDLFVWMSKLIDIIHQPATTKRKHNSQPVFTRKKPRTLQMVQSKYCFLLNKFKFVCDIFFNVAFHFDALTPFVKLCTFCRYLCAIVPPNHEASRKRHQANPMCILSSCLHYGTMARLCLHAHTSVRYRCVHAD